MDMATHHELALGTVNGQGIFNLRLDVSAGLLQEQGVGDLGVSIGLV